MPSDTVSDTMSEQSAPAMTRSDIESAIPHRDPFLWLDEVQEIDNQTIRCSKRVTDDLDVFRGHYPDYPLLPGVLQLECCFQASAVLISRIEPSGEDVPVITRVNNVQFRQMVRPGETLEIEVTIDDRVSKAFMMSGRVRVGGKVACRCEFVATAAPRPS